MEKFALIHEFEDTQCLIDQAVQTEDSDFNITVKFWSTAVNGFIAFTLGFKNEEDKFNSAWEALQVKENAREYIDNFHKNFA